MIDRISNYKNNLVKKKNGFTLVEIIVTLVILAILAAILIPSLTSYIDEANKRKYLIEARNVLMAAQSVTSNEAGDRVGNWDTENGDFTIKIFGDDFEKFVTQVNKLGELSNDITFTDSIVIKEWKIDYFVYESKEVTVIYSASGSNGHKKGFTIEPK